MPSGRGKGGVQGERGHGGDERGGASGARAREATGCGEGRARGQATHLVQSATLFGLPPCALPGPRFDP